MGRSPQVGPLVDPQVGPWVGPQVGPRVGPRGRSSGRSPQVGPLVSFQIVPWVDLHVDPLGRSMVELPSVVIYLGHGEVWIIPGQNSVEPMPGLGKLSYAPSPVPSVETLPTPSLRHGMVSGLLLCQNVPYTSFELG